MKIEFSGWREKKTFRALFWTHFLSEPLFTLYGLIAFILYKDLGATAFQIALMTMLKPVVTILSFYWSAGLDRHKKLKSNVLWAGFFMRAPFLLCPWFHSTWFLIGIAVNYMFFYRAGLPAWLEILKQNMNPEKRNKRFAWISGLGYAEGVILALGLGALLDKDPSLWTILFSGSAILGLLVLVIQARIPVHDVELAERLPLKEILIRPWKDSYGLIRSRPDFAKFQWGFMICGFGAMLLQSTIPIFAIDALHVSYTELAGALSIAKGLGFSLSSPLWARWMDRCSIFRVAGFVFLSVALFPVLLSFSMWHITWFFAAYFWYGVGQGGSHLIWNLSGPLFSGEEESSRYTGVGVVLSGLRGALGPPLGSCLSVLFHPVYVLILSAVLCVCSSWLFLRKEPEFVINQE